MMFCFPLSYVIIVKLNFSFIVFTMFWEFAIVAREKGICLDCPEQSRK